MPTDVPLFVRLAAAGAASAMFVAGALLDARSMRRYARARRAGRVLAVDRQRIDAVRSEHRDVVQLAVTLAPCGSEAANAGSTGAGPSARVVLGTSLEEDGVSSNPTLDGEPFRLLVAEPPAARTLDVAFGAAPARTEISVTRGTVVDIAWPMARASRTAAGTARHTFEMPAGATLFLLVEASSTGRAGDTYRSAARATPRPWHDKLCLADRPFELSQLPGFRPPAWTARELPSIAWVIAGCVLSGPLLAGVFETPWLLALGNAAAAPVLLRMLLRFRSVGSSVSLPAPPPKTPPRRSSSHRERAR